MAPSFLREGDRYVAQYGAAEISWTGVDLQTGDIVTIKAINDRIAILRVERTGVEVSAYHVRFQGDQPFFRLDSSPSGITGPMDNPKYQQPGERYARERGGAPCCVQCGLPSSARTCHACMTSSASPAVAESAGRFIGTCAPGALTVAKFLDESKPSWREQPPTMVELEPENAATWSDGREVECLRRELAMRKADQAGRAVHHAGQLAEVAVERDWYRNELLRVNPRLVAAHEKNGKAGK